METMDDYWQSIRKAFIRILPPSTEEDTVKVMKLLLEAGVHPTNSLEGYLFTRYYDRGPIKYPDVAARKATVNTPFVSDVWRYLPVGRQEFRGEQKGCTPLTFAVQQGDKELIGWLVKAGADMNLPDENGKTPLTMDLEVRHGCLFDFLIDEYGARLNTAQQLPVVMRIYNGNRQIKEIIRRLIAVATPGSLDFFTSSNKTPLYYFAEKDDHKIVDLLLKKGADPFLQAGPRSTSITQGMRKRLENAKLEQRMMTLCLGLHREGTSLHRSLSRQPHFEPKVLSIIKDLVRPLDYRYKQRDSKVRRHAQQTDS